MRRQLEELRDQSLRDQQNILRHQQLLQETRQQVSEESETARDLRRRVEELERELARREQGRWAGPRAGPRQLLGWQGALERRVLLESDNESYLTYRLLAASRRYSRDQRDGFFARFDRLAGDVGAFVKLSCCLALRDGSSLDVLALSFDVRDASSTLAPMPAR